MNTLVIYDQKGTLISLRSGEPQPNEPVGVPFLWAEIPEKKYIISVDVSVVPHEPVFEDYPKSDIDILKEQQADLWEIVLMGGF